LNQNLNFKCNGPKNQSHRDKNNDFEIEDIMMTHDAPLPESMSSNHSYLRNFIDGVDKSLLDESEEARRLRLSASPYYPKSSGKGLGGSEPVSLNSSASNMMQTSQLQDALKSLKDSDQTVSILKLIINELNSDQSKQLFSHLGGQCNTDTQSALGSNLQSKKYQEEIQILKADWVSLRDENKQNLKQMENLQDALERIKF